MDFVKLRATLTMLLVAGKIFSFAGRNQISSLGCGTYIVTHILYYRLFKVNGQPIFIRGGNWILSDGLLRLSKKRYQADIKFHADMNFNMIRCWGGGLAERPEFYHYCDIYGLLVSFASCLLLCLYGVLSFSFFYFSFYFFLLIHLS